MNTITRDFGYTCNGTDSKISETKSEFGLKGGGGGRREISRIL